MTCKLSPLYNDEQLDNNGLPLSGGKLYWYLANTSTLTTTYTDSLGVTPHSNPIILNSRGEPPNPIWLTAGITYKVILKDSADNQIRVIDNISGVNDTSIASFGEWIEYVGAVTYVSGTSFSVAGDQTTTFPLTRRIKASVSGGICYASITSSVFSAGVTTVGLQVDSIGLDAGLSVVNYGLLNPAFPSITVPAAGKNLIDNGNFAINQRSITSPFTSGAANQYGFDRWYTVTSGQAISWSALNNGNQITVPAGGYAQKIEGSNVKGGVYTLSWTGTATATVNGSPVINGGNVTLTAATLATVSFFSGTLAEVQLELGSSRTAFEFISYPLQLVRCQRFYWELASGSTNAFILSGGMQTNANALCVVDHPVEMKATPTITVAGAAADYYVITNSTAVGCSSLPSLASGNTKQSHISFPAVAGVGFASWGATATANAKITFTAPI